MLTPQREPPKLYRADERRAPDASRYGQAVAHHGFFVALAMEIPPPTRPASDLPKMQEFIHRLSRRIRYAVPGGFVISRN